MNAEKLNSWLGVLANIGILAGVIFLAIEIRQSNVAVTAQMQDSIADGFISLNMATITEPAVGRVWVVGLYEPDRLSDVEAIQFSMHMRGLFNQYRRVHGLYRSGLLSESDWALYAREAASTMTTPGGELHWEGNEMDPDFLADVEPYIGQESNIDLRLGRDSLPVE